MICIHIGVIVGQSMVAAIGIILGLILVRKWLRTRNRPMIHFAVYFIGCGCYLFRALIDIGFGNAEILSRSMYLIGMVAMTLGVLPGMLLLLPSTGKLKETAYKVLPLLLFVITVSAALLAPLEPTDVGIFVFQHPYRLLLLRVLHGGIGSFAIVALLYLAFIMRDLKPAVMGIGFIFVLVGTIFMGTHEVAQTIVGSIIQALGLVMFFLALVGLSKLT